MNAKKLSANDRALETMARSAKGPVAPPPTLDGARGIVADAVTGWAGVIATVHWDLYEPTRVDGIDFYVGERELGHIHLDGELHLATDPSLGADLVAAGLARPFRYARGWVCEKIDRIGSASAIALFRRNYDRLVRVGMSPPDDEGVAVCEIRERTGKAGSRSRHAGSGVLTNHRGTRGV